MTPPLTPGDHKWFHLCASGGLQDFKIVSEPLSSRARCPPLRTQIKTTFQDTDERMLQVLIQVTFPPNSKPLTYAFLLFIKSSGLKCNLRWSVRVQIHRLLKSMFV